MGSEKNPKLRTKNVREPGQSGSRFMICYRLVFSQAQPRNHGKNACPKDRDRYPGISPASHVSELVFEDHGVSHAETECACV